jgi:flagellar hook-associated protein 2
MGTISGLDPYFQNIINISMRYERQKLDRLETQQTTLNTQKKLYTSLQTMFSDLQKLTQALITKDSFYAIKAGRSSTITPHGTTAIINASVSSSAIPGEYSISVNRLATAHVARSAQQASVATPMNLSGEFYVGGRSEGPLATEVSRNANVVTAFETVADTTVSGAIDADKKQLGSKYYRVEVRKSDGTWQFRLVDADQRRSCKHTQRH